MIIILTKKVTVLPPISAIGYSYARPIKNVIALKSSVCGWKLLASGGCGLALHPMESNYIAAIDELYDAALEAI